LINKVIFVENRQIHRGFPAPVLTGVSRRWQAIILAWECQSACGLLIKFAPFPVAFIPYLARSDTMSASKCGVGCLLLVWLGSATAVAGPADVKQAQAGSELVLPLGSLPERVCWYQDQKYSLGARIQQGDSWLECGPQNELESNGPLAWREPARASHVADKAAKRSTISVGQ
jgi:hypothetical protein